MRGALSGGTMSSSRTTSCKRCAIPTRGPVDPPVEPSESIAFLEWLRCNWTSCGERRWVNASKHKQGTTDDAGHKKTAAILRLQRLTSGGVDGTRTRDPRRDRPVF